MASPVRYGEILKVVFSYPSVAKSAKRFRSVVRFDLFLKQHLAQQSQQPREGEVEDEADAHHVALLDVA